MAAPFPRRGGVHQTRLTMNTYTYVLPDIERAAVDAVVKRLFG